MILENGLKVLVETARNVPVVLEVTSESVLVLLLESAHGYQLLMIVESEHLEL